MWSLITGSRLSLLCASLAGSTTIVYSEWGADLVPLPWESLRDINASSTLKKKKHAGAGSVYAWGPFFGGKHATKVPDLPPAVHVAVCDDIVAAVTTEGTVYAFTSKNNTSEKVALSGGQRAVSTAIRRNPPSIAVLDQSGTVHVSEKRADGFAPAKVLKGALRRARIVDIDCGPNHCVALSERGEAFTWGASNSYEQLGSREKKDDDDTEIPRKVDIPREKNNIKPTFVQASCGLNHSLFLDSQGLVYGAGDDKWTQLARNAQPWISSNNSSAAETNGLGIAQLVSDLPVAAIACGDEHSVFMVRDGTLFSCGSNSFGQLGHHNFSTFAPPSPVADISVRADAVDAGGDSTCIIDAANGFVRCIGRTGNGLASKKWKYLKDKQHNSYLAQAYAIAQGGSSFAAIIKDIPDAQKG